MTDAFREFVVWQLEVDMCAGGAQLLRNGCTKQEHNSHKCCLRKAANSGFV